MKTFRVTLRYPDSTTMVMGAAQLCTLFGLRAAGETKA